MTRTEVYVWSCTDDEDSCQACKEKDGQEWEMKKDVDVWPPLPACSSPCGCRCEVIGIATVTDGNTSTVEYIP
jgi:hypothetical protein